MKNLVYGLLVIVILSIASLGLFQGENLSITHYPNDPQFVVLEGRGFQVTRLELDTEEAQVLKSQHLDRQALSQNAFEKFEATVLNQVMFFKMAEVRAREIGVLPGLKEQEEADYQDNLRYFKTTQAMEKNLVANGLSMDWMKQQIHKNAVLQKVLEKDVLHDIVVPEDSIKDYYAANQALYEIPQRKRISRVLVKLTGRTSLKQLAAAKKKIGLAYAHAQSSEDFSQVAKEFSEEPFVQRTGGDLGFITPGQSELGFDDQVTKLKTGEMSSPFQTILGLEFIKVTKFEPETKLPLEQVYKEIEAKLEQELADKKIQEYHKNLIDSFHPIYHIKLPSVE